MKPIFKAFTISILSLVISEAWSLSANAASSRVRVNETVRPVIEERPEHHMKNELMEKMDQENIGRERDVTFENKKFDTEKLVNSIKGLSDEEKLRKLNNMLEHPESIPTAGNAPVVPKQVITVPGKPLSSQDERKQYVHDLNWKTVVKSNIQAKVATNNIPNTKLPVNQSPTDRKRFMDNRRRETNNMLQDIQGKLKERDKYYRDRSLRDPYTDSLIRQILADIKKALRDVDESQLHPEQTERWIPILEEDLRMLARDSAEVDRYASTGPIISKKTDVRPKGTKVK